jgi:uncharacterized caspase-like protein
MKFSAFMIRYVVAVVCTLMFSCLGTMPSYADKRVALMSPDGTIVSYSTQAGRTAEDGNGRNSPYTTAFLKHIEDKDDITTVFHHISANVYETTKGTQLPELSLSFFGEFYLNGKMQITVAPPVSATRGTEP